MITEADFAETANDLARLNGIAPEVAADYLAAIGDTPELDEAGLAIVRNDQGEELARVRLPE